MALTNRHTGLTIAAAVLMAALASSCAGREGWALVLWPPEGSALGYGDVAPIHFKSNITKTYAVSVPGSDAKEELELWRVERYPSRKKAREAAAGYAEMAPMLGVAMRDGLILRDEPANVGSEQVYRLRLGQPVKLLRRVDGAAVETGGERLAGDWYLALADDGSTGYVFSNQLTLWNAEEEPMPDLAAGSTASSESLSLLFDNVWRPDYFDAMVASGKLDLAAYQPRYGIFTDPLRNQIRVERPVFSRIYRYDSIDAREDGSFEILPGGASFRFTKSGRLVFVPAASELPPEAAAKLREDKGPDAELSYEFVRHAQDVQAVVAAEERRRMSVLAGFVAGGERFESEAYGALIITRSGRFTWAAYGALTPDVIPEGAGEIGSVSMDLYLSPELSVDWDGAFTLRFDGEKRPAVSFAYAMDGDELLLAYLPPGSARNAVVEAPDGLEPVAALKRYR